jgi:outer membrane protein OmpA-like peptidoglycan-associated protein
VLGITKAGDHFEALLILSIDEEENMAGVFETELEAHSSSKGELAAVLAELEAGGGGSPAATPSLTIPTIYVMTGRPFQVLSRFAFDRANLTPDHVSIVSGIVCEVAASLGTSSHVETVVMQGHTDGIGTVDYDYQLGKRRAEAVGVRLRVALDSLRPGITRKVELVAQSSGKGEPIASNDAPACRALNRRVEVFLVRAAPSGGFPWNQIWRFLRQLGIPITLDATKALAKQKKLIVGGRTSQNVQSVLTRGQTLARLRSQISAPSQPRRRFVCPCGEGLKICAVFLPAKVCVCTTISLFPPQFMIKFCGVLPGQFA